MIRTFVGAAFLTLFILIVGLPVIGYSLLTGTSDVLYRWGRWGIGAAMRLAGVRVRAEGTRAFVASTVREGPTWRAGVDAGDELVSIGGARVEGTNLDAILRGRAPGESVDILVARDGRMQVRAVTLDAARAERLKIVAARDASVGARAAFTAWLGLPYPSARVRSGS